MGDGAQATDTTAGARLVIEPSAGRLSLGLKDIWECRELLYFLTWRDVLIRYKQAALGVAWAILQPLLAMLIFTLIFGRLARLPSDGIPYPLFAFAGLLPWLLFAGSLQRAGISLVGNANLLTKVYFPRMIIPVSAVLTGLVDFAFAFVVFLGMMAYYGVPVTWNIIWLPVFVLFSLLSAFSVALWLSALNVRYRDVQHALPFLIQIWMFASPVAYSANMVPGGFWSIVYGLNPIAGAIQGFRWSLFGGSPPSELIGASMAAVFLLFVSGLLYFRRMEETFADVV